MREAFVSKRFRGESLAIIEAANHIIGEYQDAGYNLTLRQLYYQFVSRDLIPNTMKSYKRLGSIINDARLAGYIDWEAIEDRTRSLRSRSQWESPEQITLAVAQQFHIDLWQGQFLRPEVWIEKDALIGVIEQKCHDYDVAFFSCRGYVSQSEMYGAAMRIQNRCEHTVILHFGDHDPSGIDMTRDIRERLSLFGANKGHCTIIRCALNEDQIKKFKPPPNPTKEADSRSPWYIKRFGTKSWELDALPPDALNNILDQRILACIEKKEEYMARIEERQKGRDELTLISNRFGDVVDWLKTEQSGEH